MVEFFKLSNGGFYVALKDDKQFHMISPNGFECDVDVNTAGIIVSAFAYSNLSFGRTAKPSARNTTSCRTSFSNTPKRAKSAQRSIKQRRACREAAGVRIPFIFACVGVFPGVADYEILEVFFVWFGQEILSSDEAGIDPDGGLCQAKLLELTTMFFEQGMEGANTATGKYERAKLREALADVPVNSSSPPARGISACPASRSRPQPMCGLNATWNTDQGRDNKFPH